MLPGDFAATIDKGVKLGIVGLNSSFLQLKAGKVRKKLALHVRQFHQSCGGNGITWTNKHHVCLLMTHHPPSWLTSQAQQALDGGIHEPPQRFALHLFGHTHESELRSVAIGGSDARRRLQGCSLFSFEEWEDEKRNKQERQYGYSLGQLEINPKGTAALRIWPRVATNKQNHGWEFDPDKIFSRPKGQEATEWMPIKLLRSPFPNVGVTEKMDVPELSFLTSGGMLRPAYQILPITDTAFFTGRETQLDQLCDRLLRVEGTTERPLLAGIWGPPGAGKSALAAVFAERMAEHFPDGVLTVDVRTNPTPEAIAYHFASLIGIPVNPDHEGRWKAAEIMQSRFAMRRCLLILDNADEGTFREIYSHGRSALLVTSKNRSVLLRMGLQGSDLTHANRLSPDEARLVLTKILGQEKVSAEPDAVEQLLALIGCLAMAVRIAGGAIAEQIGPRPIARYLKRLQERSTDLASALQLDGDEELQLARVFELSLDLLKPERTAVTFEITEPRISYVQLSVCAPAGFSRAVTETVVDLPSAMAEDRLSRFVNLVLLEHQAITDRFRFHPLLQSFARQKANVWDVYSKVTVAHRRFFSRYVRTRAAYTTENLAALVAEQDAIMMVAWERVREGEFDLAFIKGLNTLLEKTGQWEVAIDLAEMALNKSSVLDNWTQAVLLLQRGKHRQIQGDLDAAIADFKESS